MVAVGKEGMAGYVTVAEVESDPWPCSTSIGLSSDQAVTELSALLLESVHKC